MKDEKYMSVSAIITGVVVFIILFGGVLYSRATPQGALAAMIVGGTIGVVSFIVGLPGRSQSPFNIDLGLFAAYTISAIVFVAVSQLTSQKKRSC